MKGSVQDEAPRNQSAMAAATARRGLAWIGWKRYFRERMLQLDLEVYSLAITLYFASMILASGVMGNDSGRLAGLMAALSLWLGLNSWGAKAEWRHWGSLATILPAYWAVEEFARSHATRIQNDWLRWDRWLLDELGIRAAIERLGSIGPSALEWAYLLLYGFPPLALGLVYRHGARGRASRFLNVLFPGTLGVYALLPLLPVQSPRLAFPGQDLPGVEGVPRIWNLWLLDRLDISTGVFPSGHVAVAFSTAFGLLSAMPERKPLIASGFTFAAAVYLATVYGRYHYAMDGLASMAIAGIAWRVATRMGKDVS